MTGDGAEAVAAAVALATEQQQSPVNTGQKPLNLSTLAAASPEEQKRMLGEHLFPLIRKMNPQLVGKITGMLLEIDNADLLQLLEDRTSLKAKVDEAVAVMEMYWAQQQTQETEKLIKDGISVNDLSKRKRMAPTTPTSCIGKDVSELETPSFLVDLEKVTKNCQSMKDSCQKLNLIFRPCTNTHRTLEGAKLQTIEKKGIMCRSLDEVEHLASNGFDDILYGFPLIKANMPRVSKLAEKLKSLYLTVDNWQAVSALKDTAPPSGKTWSVLLMVDCGAKREGVWWEAEDGVKFVQNMKDCKHITFKGVYAFCGNAYEGTETMLEKIRDETIERLLKFVARLTAIDVKCITIGLGGTPICKTPGPNMKKLTELHSENYIFNDLQQCTLGTKRGDIACSIATRIVGHYPHRKQMLVDCGVNGLSTIGQYGQNMKDMGYAIVKDEPNLRVSAVFQDFGVVEAVSGDLDYSKYPIGTLIQLLPWHASGTSLLYKKYHVMDTKGKVSQEWSPVTTC